jgi:hypothetical protein
MPHRWPEETDFALWELDVLDRDCASCGRRMHICDHRFRHLFTLEGPVRLVCKLNHCPDPNWVQPVWLQLSRDRKSLKYRGKVPARGIGPCPPVCLRGHYSQSGAEM